MLLGVNALDGFLAVVCAAAVLCRWLRGRRRRLVAFEAALVLATAGLGTVGSTVRAAGFAAIAAVVMLFLAVRRMPWLALAYGVVALLSTVALATQTPERSTQVWIYAGLYSAAASPLAARIIARHLSVWIFIALAGILASIWFPVSVWITVLSLHWTHCGRFVWSELTTPPPTLDS